MRGGARPVVAAGLVLAVAGALRLIGLSNPPFRYGDEIDYALDLQGRYAGPPQLLATIPKPPPGLPVIQGDLSWVHPPLGKLLIAWGEQLFGANPVGWRMSAAVFGILGVALVYAMALTLWRSSWWAALPALLLAEDGLHIVHSRIAMLDVFEVTFATAGMACLLVAWRAQAKPGRAAGWWEAAAGALLGAAIACKWSGMFLLLPGLVVCCVVAWRHGGARWRAVGLTVCRLAVLPVAVYMATYSAFFVEHGVDAGGFARLQLGMLRYQTTYQLQGHPMASAPISWPLILRPFTFYYAPIGISPSGALLPDSREKEIEDVGNPVLWWAWLGLAPLAAWGALRRRRWDEALALGGYLCCWLPWLFIGRTQFFYYMLPATPFMALGACAGLRAFGGRLQRPLAIGFAAASTMAAVAFAPHWLGLAIPLGWSDGLRWLNGWT